MQVKTSADIRRDFLDFFEGKGHVIVPSASLVPTGDPTLLFTNAGMNQFKDVFLNLAPARAPRIADSQKCMRVSGKHNDLEDVGPSPYHHTLFEMLGNWSFGDYYQKEAIAWAWELLTSVWELPREHLYATVFQDDKGEIDTDTEAVKYWTTETDIQPDHILPFGRKDNFWEMGETGPCGPCSEIHFDRGPEFCDLDGVSGHQCRVNGDCHRFIELWNLVFIQYNSQGGGRLEALPARHVDTGLGFERLVMVLQGGASNYDTDVFAPVFARIQDLAAHSDAQRRVNVVPYRVIADHSRAAAFLIGDGVLPGNVGRGYVLRMVIRRAARFGRKAGFSTPFLAGVAAAVIETMSDHYRELRDRREHILRTITQEEERFMRTLDQGLNVLGQLISEMPAGTTRLSGADAFDLYATYGLPVEITRDVVGEQGYTVDDEGFRRAMATHRDLSSASTQESYGAELAFYAALLDQLKTEGSLDLGGVVNDPYNELQILAPIVAMVRNGERVLGCEKGDQVAVILPSTPFYVESGGQVSDTGLITGKMNQVPLTAQDRGPWRIEVQALRQPVPGLILHEGCVVEGQPAVGDAAMASVNRERRRDIMRNHTATHLLHRALRQILGGHVQQAGSLVDPDRLRFDFTHNAGLSQIEMDQINESVNQAILGGYPLSITYESYAKALDSNIIALFGEKYGDVVRVVRIGQPSAPISQELCGGTHVRDTADIGSFQIVSEGSIGAGLRRIEAVTGRAAGRWVSQQLQVLREAAAHLECQPEELEGRLLALIDSLRAAQKEIDHLRDAVARHDFELLMNRAQNLDGIAVLAARVEVSQVDTLRAMTDWFRERYPSGVVVLGAVISERPLLIAAVTDDVVNRGVRAHELVRELAPLIGGGGGGRPTLAQAGGRDATRLDETLSGAVGLVERLLA